jgi:hypothetical protein
LRLIQGRVALNLDPQRIQLEYPLLPPNADFYDVLTDPSFDKSPYVVLYEAEMYPDGNVIVKRDLFGKNDYPHTWSGWPIPGDEPTGTPTAKEANALKAVRRKK